MPSFNAGDIEARLTLDRDPFNRELKAAQQQVRRFEKDPIEAKLTATTKSFDQSVKEASVKADKLAKKKADVKVTADADSFDQTVKDAIVAADKLAAKKAAIKVAADARDWQKTFDKVLADTDRLDAKSATLQFKADADIAGAQAKFNKLRLDAEKLDQTDVDIEVDVDPSGAGGQRLRGLTTLLVGLAPVAVPAVAATTAAVVGLTGALVAGGLAGGVFGLAVGGAVKSAGSANKELDELREKLGETADAAERAKILADIDVILDDMSKSAATFGDDLDAMSMGWERFIDATETTTLAAAGQGVRTLTDAMAPLPGVVNAVAPAMNRFTGGIDNWVHGDGYRSFLGFLTVEGPPAFNNLIRMSGGLTTGISGVVRAFTPFGQGLLAGIADDMERFADAGNQLGSTQGFNEFIAYVNENGPRVSSTLGAMVDALIEIGVALSPLGGPALIILQTFAETLSLISDAVPGLVPAAVTIYALSRAALSLGDAVVATRGRIDNFNSVIGATGRATGRWKSALLGSISTLGGPWGLALTGGAIALGAFASAHADAEAREESLADSLNQTTGAVEKSTRAIAAKQLAEAGAIDDARLLGITEADLTNAYLGQPDALAKVKAAIDAADISKGKFADDSTAAAAALHDESVAAQNLTGIIASGNKTIDERRGIIDKTQTALGGYLDASSGLRFATRQEAAAHRDAGKAIQGQVDSLDELVASMQAARAEAIKGKNAQLDYEEALDAAAEGIKGGARAHDVSHEKGQANWRLLLQLAAAQNAYADDTLFTSKSVKAQSRILAAQRSDFIDTAQSMGFTKERARELADQYLKTPKEINTKAKLEAERAKLDRWKNDIVRLEDLDPHTRAKFEADHRGVRKWEASIDGITPLKPTSTKLIADIYGARSWDQRIDDIQGKKDTDTKLHPDTGGVNRWKSHLNTVPERENTNLDTTESTGGISSFISRLAAVPRTITTVLKTITGGSEGGLVTRQGIIPAYADGGIHDVRHGAVLPGYSTVDDTLALLRRGEGVVVPEVVKWLDDIGMAVPALNRLARQSRLPEPAHTGGPTNPFASPAGTGRGGITIESVNIHNPVGQTSERTLIDTAEIMNIIYGSN